jgi:hypothetical protein
MATVCEVEIERDLSRLVDGHHCIAAGETCGSGEVAATGICARRPAGKQRGGAGRKKRAPGEHEASRRRVH